MTFVKSEIKPLKKGADMGSLLRRVKERKKTRRLGEVEVMEQEGYGELEVDSKVEMIRALVPLGLMHVQPAQRTLRARGAGCECVPLLVEISDVCQKRNQAAQERSRYGKSATKGQGTQEDASSWSKRDTGREGRDDPRSLMMFTSCWTPFGNRRRCRDDVTGRIRAR